MIQANELRIGNIIFELEIITVKSILERGVNADERGAIIPFDMLCGIPLSPEILEACGFDNREGYLWFLNDDFYVHFRDGSLVYNGLPDGAPTLRNLHQLQNLYFALTGTELTINLEKVKV